MLSAEDAFLLGDGEDMTFVTITVADENGNPIENAVDRVLVEVDPKYFRPAEVEQLLGDPTKAKEKLGWNPHKTSFEELVRIMVEHDMRFVRKLYLKAQMPE